MVRPQISHYDSPAEFVKDMIAFRKREQKSFSVFQATKGLRKISPALVSLIIKGRRTVTLDRADEFAKLLDLNVAEKFYFRQWIGQLEKHDFQEGTPSRPQPPSAGSRKEVGLGLLSDWINVYVKDFFMLKAVQKNPTLIEKQMRSIAPPQRIQRAINFLLREGYLRKTLEGKMVLETELAITEPNVPSKKIRQFHKGAMQIAKLALDLFPPSERLANTLILPLDESRYQELQSLIQEFAEKLKDFAAQNENLTEAEKSAQRLYQLIVNLSPVGGKLE